MANNMILFLQQNLARRHEPTATLNKILDDLAFFNFKRRKASLLSDRLRSNECEHVCSFLLKFTDAKGFLPRITPIALIQEPNLSGGHITGFSGKKLIYTSNRPRAAIVTLVNSNIKLLANYSNADIASAIIFDGNDRLYISSFYHDINISSIAEPLTKLVGDTKSILIGGDSNAHSTLWGSQRNNPRGDTWENFLISNKLSLLNNDSSGPTFRNHLGQSYIDITASTLPDKFSDWHNSDIQNGSDHFLLMYFYGNFNCLTEKFYQNIATCDWTLFVEQLPHIDVDNLNIKTTCQLNDLANTVTKNITSSFNIACKPKPAFPGKPNRWWSKDLTILIRKKNIAAKEILRFQGTNRGIRALKKKKGLSALIQKRIRLAKTESWQNFISSQNTPRNIASLFKKMKLNEQYADMPLLRDQNDQIAKNLTESLRILQRSHFIGSASTYSINVGNNDPFDQSLRERVEKYVNITRLDKAINDLPTGKSPGPDGIKNEVLKHLPKSYRLTLVEIFTCSILSEFIPATWLNINTIFIKKAAKSDLTNPKTYRPIGLSSSILKLSERLINWQIKSTVLSKGIPFQHAFTMNRSTETAISELVNLMEKAKQLNLNAVIISLDIEGAFDRVPFDTIKEALIGSDTSSEIIAWIDYLSRNRKVTITQNNVTIAFRPQMGTTQGGLNSPDLWVIVIWSIIFTKAVKKSKLIKFADDFISAILGIDLPTLLAIMQECLNEFADWFHERGLKVSAQKSFCMIISNKKDIPSLRPLRFDNHEIPYVNSFKYLGITIDSKLSWKLHIQNKLNKAKKDLMVARRLVDKKWGLTPDKALWIYTAIVRPSIEYACHVWFPPRQVPVWLMKELDKVQRLALVNTTSCIRSTPTRALERLVNIPPLHLHLKEKTLLTIARIYHSVNNHGWDGIGTGHKRGHLFHWCKKLGSNLAPVIRNTLYNFNSFAINLTTIADNAEIRIYTDGSKVDDKVGLGWLIVRDNFVVSEGSKNLPPHSSVFDAEILALTWSIKDLLLYLSNKRAPSSIGFYIDNQATILTLNKTRLSNDLQIGLVNMAASLTKKYDCQITFNWIKSHNNNTGNETADMLAKNGTRSSDTLTLPHSISHIKSVLRKRTKTEWKNFWKTLPNCRQSKELITYEPNQREAKYVLKKSRTQCRKLVALMTGHNYLRYHLFKQYVNDNPNYSPCCRFCKEQTETSWHLMMECPSLESKRRSARYSPENPKHGPDIEDFWRQAMIMGILELVLSESQCITEIEND